MNSETNWLLSIHFMHNCSPQYSTYIVLILSCHMLVLHHKENDKDSVSYIALSTVVLFSNFVERGGSLAGDPLI